MKPRRETKVDPLQYSMVWAKAMPVPAELEAEVSHIREALASHACLLYDNPLAVASSITRSQHYKFVREQLKHYSMLLKRDGFLDVISTLKDAAMLFLRGFKNTSHLTFEMDDRLLYVPIWRCIKTLEGRILRDRDIPFIQWALSWLLYLSKLPVDRPDLLYSAETAWVDRQVNPIPITLTSYDLDGLRRVARWLYQYDGSALYGNHGPGFTAGGFNTVAEKNMAYEPSLQTSELATFDVDMVPYVLRSKPQPSQLEFVPKDIKSLRPITMEAPSVQFAQQGLKHHMYYCIDVLKEYPASRFLRFSDQTLSQSAALRGSALSKSDVKPATIDSSFASDFMSVDLITLLFQGDFLHLLMCGRSWECETDLGKIELSMFGGMGSALTFPVQSLVFTAAAIWATIKTDALRTLGCLPEDPGDILYDYLDINGFKKVYKAFERSIQVYGDDICLPDFAAPFLCELLAQMGLSVNEDKSFIGSIPIRESCGIYACAGHDITPLRFRLKPAKKRELLDASLFEGARQAVNRSFIFGYRHLYRFFISYVKNRRLFISGKEYRRLERAGRDYPSQKMGVPELLFEAYRGDVDYIGFLSIRDSKPNVKIMVWEKSMAFTTYSSASDEDDSPDCEYYHLTLSYRGMEYTGFSSQSHGKTPRGVRLIKRNAIRVLPKNTRNRTMVWGWAPR